MGREGIIKIIILKSVLKKKIKIWLKNLTTFFDYAMSRSVIKGGNLIRQPGRRIIRNDIYKKERQPSEEGFFYLEKIFKKGRKRWKKE